MTSKNQVPIVEQIIDDSAMRSKMKNPIISQNATKKDRDFYCEEVLPKAEISSNGLSSLFKKTKQLQKDDKQIENEDIRDYITKTTQVRLIVEKIENFKRSHPKYFSDPQNFNLFQIYLFMTGWNLFVGMSMSILYNCLSCGCIFIMDIITDKLKDYDASFQQKRDICLLLLGISVTYIIKNILYTQYQWYSAKWQANCRATLQYLVLSKSLKTQIISGSSTLDGQQSEDASYEDNPDVNNIMTVDIDQSQYVYWALVESVCSVITIIIVLFLIYYRIGSAIFKGLYMLLGAFCFNILITQLMQYFYRRQYKKKDSRVSLSKDVIEGWEDIFKKKIEQVRKSEFGYIITTRTLDGVLSIFWNCVNYFLLFFFLVSYVDDGNDLKDSNVFTIIALFGILTGPIGLLPWTFSYLVKARVTYKRIQKFMNEREINYENSVNLDLEFSKKANSTQQSNLFESVQDSGFGNQVSSIAISIKKMKFFWPVKKSSKELKEEKKEEMLRKKQEKKSKVSNSVNDALLDSQYESNNSEIKQNQSFELKVPEFTVNKGELAIIIGKIGSGKTALLNAILNELDSVSMDLQESLLASKIEGSAVQEKLTNYEKKIIVNGRFGYVSQNHWLQNKTIKENILFGQEYDEKLYNECVDACDLRVDFNTFSKKDEKIIGPGGGNLSGGQRQRIAICRAIYQNADVYLFDDIFSSLDAHVAEKIYKSIIIDLIYKKLQKTVLLVTSHFSIFENRENISKIFFLKKGNLVYDKDEIEEFIKSGLSKELEEEEAKKQKKKLVMDVEQDEKVDQIEDEADLLLTRRMSNQPNEIEEDLQVRRKQSSKFNLKIVDEEEETKKTQEEEREKGSIKFETFSTYFKSMNLFFLFLFFITNFLMEGSQMITDFWLRDFVSPSSSFFEYINELFKKSFTKTFLFFIVVNLGMTSLRAVFYCICALLSGRRLFNRLNQSIVYSKMTFFDKNPVGRIVNRLSDDILAIDDFLPWNCHVFMEQVAYTFGYPVGIMVQFPWLIVFVLISIVMIYFIQKIFRISNREIKRLNSVNSGKVLSVIGETCKGLILIRSFDREKYMLKEYMEKLNDSVNTFLITNAIQIWMSVRLLFISNFLFVCVAVTSCVIIVANFDFNYNTVAMCLTYSMLLSSRFSDLIYFFCSVEQNMVSVERVRQYFNNDQEKPDEIIEAKEEGDIEQKPQKSSEFAIEFENVYITYDEIEGKEITKETPDIQFALKDICLQIKKGEKIAFCGRTGSGKTSILNTLFSMYSIQFGNIYVNGKNIQSYSLRDLRQRMSIIPQFGFLYNATLRDNLDPESKIPKDIIQKKINDTNLRIRDHTQDDKKNKDEENKEQEITIKKEEIKKEDEKAEVLKDENLDFEINDGGQNLSNGEKQIVNFLRIILRETDIVCLDEATSNMDPKTDAELHEQIFKFANDKTLLVITHRLENIELFDRVVVLEKGRIVECGPVQELRKIEGGFFNRLLKNQQK